MDRVFHKSKIKDICDDLKDVMKECEEHLEGIKDTAYQAINAAAQVPAEASTGAVESAARNFISAAGDINFSELTGKLSSCKTRVELISRQDKRYAAETDSVKTQIKTITQVLARMEGFLGKTSLAVDYEDFMLAFEPASKQWNKDLDDTRQVIEQIKDNLKGAERISMMFSLDPVNLSTGNFIYDRTDLQIGGSTPFIFRRFYNAINKRSGSLGDGWNHNYEVKLAEDGDEKVLSLEEGKEERFLKTSTGGYASLYHSNGSLEETDQGYRYQTADQTVYYFDAAGYYLRQEEPSGAVTILHYAEMGQARYLSKVERTTGEAFILTYSKEGYLYQVMDHSGRTVTYQMQGAKLIGVCTPKGNWYRYGYSSNGKLESVQNPREIVTVENVYDEQIRTVHQKFPDGGSMSYEYDDENRSVTLTERNGSNVTYIHDEKFRDVKHIYGDGEERFEYNKLNQKTLVVDKLGNRTQYGYDPKGNLTRIINPLGVKTELKYDDNNQPVYFAVNGECKVKNTYDDAGNLTETIDALGNRYAVTYKKQGQPEIIIQPDGSRIRLGYDARGNINTLTDAVGNISRYRYDALNRVTETVDGNGNVTKYAYDAEGNITEVINGKGDIRCYTYNESNKVTQIRDFDGSTIKREYNVLNRPSKVIDQLGRETLLTYDAMWNLARITEPNGAKTTFFYNESNRLGRIKNANGDVIRYTYDANGKRTGITDEEGNKTHFTYDALGQLVQAEGPEGMKFVYTYTKEGQISSITDALGNTVYAEYNAAGQLIREIDPLGEKREYTYSPLGRLTGITDEAGRKINYTYEPGGQLIRKEFPDGTRETYTYDGNGNIKTYTDPLGNTLTYSYDSLDYITQIEGDQGEIRSYTYDAVGNVTSMTDAAGNRTEYCYTLTGQLSKITDPLGNEVEYTYDERDQLIQIRQSESSGMFGIDADLQQAMGANKEGQADRSTWYQRDLEGQIKTITDALGEEEHYRYDRTGQLIEKVDKEGYLTKYGYTGLGDIRSIQYADGREVRFSYNSLRQLEKMEDWLGVTRIENDALGRVVKVTDAKARTVSYTWGKAGERKAITYPGGKQVEYHYDECLRLKEVRAQSTQVTYGYDEFSRLKEKVFTDGLKTEYTYNPVGQLASLSHWTQGRLTDQYRYEYDKMGNRISIEKKRAESAEESGIYEYGYDPLQRLQEVKKDGQLLRRYQYDGYGNRTGLLQGEQQIRYTYNQVNQLIGRKDSQNEDRYHYDRRGNLTEVWKDGVCTDQYVFGALGRLERAFCHQKGAGADYAYNGLGNRVGKTEGRLPEPGSSAVTIKQLSLIPTKQVYDLLDLTRSYHNLLERDEDGKTASYTWDGNLLGMTGTDGKEYHYGLDGSGSPIRLFDETGGLQQTYGYDEFGNDLYQNQGVDQPFGYTGYQFDTVTGIYFAQTREYAPENGGFISKDSDQFLHLGIPQSLNQYSYCFQNPILYVDPLGTDVYYYYDPNTFPTGRDIEKDVKADKKALKKHYGTKVHVKKLTAKQKFIDDWNAMPDEKIDAVVIYSHANHDLFYTKSQSAINGDGSKYSKGVEYFTVPDVTGNLSSKDIDIMVMLGCNMGATSENDNLATEFIKSDNNLGIHKLIASDGSVHHQTEKGFLFFIKHRHMLRSLPSDKYHPDGINDGFKLYRYVDGQLQWNPIGYEFDSIVELLKAGEALCAE